MNEREIVARFEAGDPGAFHHADHVRTAWAYVRTMPLAEAIDRFTAALRRFAAAQGKPGLYHETITWAYLLLIHERLARTADAMTWEDFSRRNEDLFTWKPSVLDRYYRAETLASDFARRVFVMPDRG